MQLLLCPFGAYCADEVTPETLEDDSGIYMNADCLCTNMYMYPCKHTWHIFLEDAQHFTNSPRRLNLCV